VPESPVPPVEPCGVCAQKPLHSSHQIGLGRFRHQMKMIAHQTIGMDLPFSLQAGLGQCFKEPFPIRVILENRLLPITAVHDMINRSWVLEPKFSGHASHPTQPGELLSIAWSDPFTFMTPLLYFTKRSNLCHGTPQSGSAKLPLFFEGIPGPGPRSLGCYGDFEICDSSIAG